MADVFTKPKRSEIMSKVLGRGNKATEVVLIKVFRKFHITGWRRHLKMFGNPDFVFHKMRLAIFVDGCFWHSCPKHGSQPLTNCSFWRKKLKNTVARDKLVNLTLRKNGWRVLRVWQHDLIKKNEPKLVGRFRKVLALSHNIVKSNQV